MLTKSGKHWIFNIHDIYSEYDIPEDYRFEMDIGFADKVGVWFFAPLGWKFDGKPYSTGHFTAEQALANAENNERYQAASSTHR